MLVAHQFDEAIQLLQDFPEGEEYRQTAARSGVAAVEQAMVWSLEQEKAWDKLKACIVSKLPFGQAVGQAVEEKKKAEEQIGFTLLDLQEMLAGAVRKSKEAALTKRNCTAGPQVVRFLKCLFD